MISCYERSLFEQQTPYLQWLKERESKREVRKENEMDNKKGKQMRKLPFLSCNEKVSECLKRADESIQEADVILFAGEKGILEERAEELFAEYFSAHTDVMIAYADEDYLGTLQEMYGEKVEVGELAKEYQYKNTGLYRGEPWFKPDYSPDTLQSFFYFGNIFAIRGKAFTQFVQNAELSIYEMVLRLTEQTKYAGHISEVLFTNEIKMQDIEIECNHNACILAKNEIETANDNAKEEVRLLCKHNSEKSLISIIIPSKDNSQIVKRCLSTLVELTDYPHYEIILVDNGSSKQEQMWIRSGISEIEEDYDLKWADDDAPMPALCVQYIYQKAEFNFSSMCNLGAKAAKGEYLLFLNDDMEIIEPSWMRKMLQKASQEHVGAVGAKLCFPKEKTSEEKQDKDSPYKIQHTGITNMGIGPAHKLAGMEDKGILYHGHNRMVYNMLAVTGACLMVEKERFWKAGGFDETLAVAYNDVELCFKLYEAGYYNVQRNDVVLLHHESLSRGQDTSPKKAQRLEQEKRLLYKKHPLLKGKDPFYSGNLVQWKKDVDYHCNYLYPYDKVADAILLEKKAAAKLPKEHRNRLLRKLTGENRMMLQIDRIEDNTETGTILIQGWFAMRGCDNAIIEKQMLLKNKESGEIYQLTVYPKLRYDVQALFKSQTEDNGQKTRNTALSGIHVILEKSALTKGTYMIGILTQEKKSFCIRKIYWKSDCTVEIS